ncbi:monoglyceride lipase isoform X1 [Poecile atricapillus]|uniref:monoglyceride lipase isoform X1 n=1 Tax=Poecile atricapillus TaxID=48891 RepID=UPI002739235B|nr:monoglyceride lipase isoform X1 [Poecile atricapillus]
MHPPSIQPPSHRPSAAVSLLSGSSPCAPCGGATAPRLRGRTRGSRARPRPEDACAGLATWHRVGAWILPPPSSPPPPPLPPALRLAARGWGSCAYTRDGFAAGIALRKGLPLPRLPPSPRPPNCHSSRMPEESSPKRSPQNIPYKDLPHIINADGQYLFCRYWKPAASPRALVFIAHGAGEHCGRYDDLAQKLTGLNLFVFAHDHVGHGQSEGDRMVVSDFHIFIRDSLQHIDLMKKEHPELPVLILGHSMGGAISILTASERPSEFSGMLLISPLVVASPEVATPIKVFAAKVLNFVLPNLSLGSIDPSAISRNKKEMESYTSDPLVYHGGMKVSFVIQLMNAIARIERALPKLTLPILVLHGSSDKLCDIRGSYLLMDTVQSQDKTLKVYEEAYHALHKELPEVSTSVFTEILTWIGQKVSAAGETSHT